ncbi:MAG TPA: AMP-binding protein, partial [Candidatus Wallbacteria bacterium]|nr:AMP-binding protein [Candidatus Wallbacteria bacterium]
MNYEKPDYRNEKFNIASYLPYMAARMPHKRAVIFPAGRDKAGRVAYTHLTFSQLNEECDRYADGLNKYGIGKGVKTLLMVRPSLEFIALAFALFKTGAVPILIDPGMGIFNVLKCVAGVGPEAVIAVPEVHAAKSVLRWYFKSVKYSVTVGKNWFWRGLTLDKIKQHGRAPFECAATLAGDPAAILFTSGSTGPAKGVLYEHRMFGAQVELLKEAYKFEENEIELPGFPLFALFNVALGMSCAIPDMDPTRPAQVDPAKIVEGILNQGVTNTFGSPAIWNRVADYCGEKNIKLNSIKRILIAGAPVSGELIGRVKKMLPETADVHTPYGATESLPLCNICGNDILKKGWPETKRGAGILVG